MEIQDPENLECPICRDFLVDAVRLPASPIPYCRDCIRLWLLMAPTPARRVCPLSGAPFPPGASLVPDAGLTARAAAARAAAAAAVEPGTCVQIGEYLFDHDGYVLGRVAVEEAAVVAQPCTEPAAGPPGKPPPAGEEETGERQHGGGGLLAKLGRKGRRRRRRLVAVTAATVGAGAVE